MRVTRASITFAGLSQDETHRVITRCGCSAAIPLGLPFSKPGSLFFLRELLGVTLEFPNEIGRHWRELEVAEPVARNVLTDLAL